MANINKSPRQSRGKQMPPKKAARTQSDASLARVASESALFSSILQDQCREASDLMSMTSKLYDEAIELVRGGFYVIKHDSFEGSDKERLCAILDSQHDQLVRICNENAQLKSSNAYGKSQLDAAKYSMQCLRDSLLASQAEEDKLRVALAIERRKIQELSDELAREKANVDALMSFCASSAT